MHGTFDIPDFLVAAKRPGPSKAQLRANKPASRSAKTSATAAEISAWIEAQRKPIADARFPLPAEPLRLS